MCRGAVEVVWFVVVFSTVGIGSGGMGYERGKVRVQELLRLDYVWIGVDGWEDMRLLESLGVVILQPIG